LYLARSTFLLLLVWASAASAETNQCYNNFDACNRSPIAQSDPAECTRQYHQCIADVERDARDAAMRDQEQQFRNSKSNGHGGGYANADPEAAAPAPQPRAALNTRPQSYSDIPLSPSRAMKRDDDISKCPQSAYPYQGPNGVVCTSTGAIAQQNLLAVRGRVENEMMGFFAEISRKAE